MQSRVDQLPLMLMRLQVTVNKQFSDLRAKEQKERERREVLMAENQASMVATRERFSERMEAAVRRVEQLTGSRRSY